MNWPKPLLPTKRNYEYDWQIYPKPEIYRAPKYVRKEQRFNGFVYGVIAGCIVAGLSLIFWAWVTYP